MQNFNSKYKIDLKLKAYSFSLKILALSDKLPNKRSAWVIADQLIRSATSIGANIVEAQAASSRLEFKKFNEIALKSANETKYWICLLRDAKIINSPDLGSLLEECVEISKMLAAGILRLKGK